MQQRSALRGSTAGSQRGSSAPQRRTSSIGSHTLTATSGGARNKASNGAQRVGVSGFTNPRSRVLTNRSASTMTPLTPKMLFPPRGAPAAATPTSYTGGKVLYVRSGSGTTSRPRPAGGNAAGVPGLAMGRTLMAPVVHVRVRPPLHSLGESGDARRVWFLDHENLVVRPSRRAGVTGTPRTGPLSLSSSAVWFAMAPPDPPRPAGAMAAVGSSTGISRASSEPSKQACSQRSSTSGLPSQPRSRSPHDGQGGGDCRGSQRRGGKPQSGLSSTAHTPRLRNFLLDSRDGATPLTNASAGRGGRTRSRDRSIPPPPPSQQQHQRRQPRDRLYGPSWGPAYALPIPTVHVHQQQQHIAATEEEAAAGREQHFAFEFVHDEAATQEEVFEDSVLRFADEALLAHNISILCYGPTGSGKTYSMMGSQGSAATGTARGKQEQRRDNSTCGPFQHMSGNEDRGTSGESDDSDADSVGSLPAPPRSGAPLLRPDATADLGADMETTSIGILPRLVHALLDRCGETMTLKHGDTPVTASINPADGGNGSPHLTPAEAPLGCTLADGKEEGAPWQVSLTLRKLTFYGAEIYLDELSDLLDPAKRPITTMGDTGGLAAFCQHLDQSRAGRAQHSHSRGAAGKQSRVSSRAGAANANAGGGIPITSMKDLRRAYQLARRNRVTSAHAKNDTSSRSHAIFILQLGFELVDSHSTSNGTQQQQQREQEEQKHLISSYVAMVDLAGCERVKDTQVEGAALREAQYINKSLSALSSVVLALYKRASHIPYRDSKLTRLLRPCLEDGRVLLLVHVSPCSSTETIRSLKFADQLRHAQVRTHGFYGDTKRQLHDIFEDLIDPAQGLLEEAFSAAQHQYNQLCAEVRLAYLTQFPSLLEAGQPPSSAPVAEDDSILPPTGSSGGRRADVICRLVHAHMRPCRRDDAAVLHDAARRAERDRDRRVEAAMKRMQQETSTFRATIAELERFNAQLAEENTTPLPQDPYSQELTRQLRETTEELNEATKNRWALSGIVATLRQRVAQRIELESFVELEVEELAKRNRALLRLEEHARERVAGDSLDCTQVEDQLASSHSTSYVDMQLGTDMEMRDIGHQQVLLAKELASLRFEVACFEMGDVVWEGLWCRTMRHELLTAMKVEQALMEDTLLDERALGLLMQEVPDIVKSSGQKNVAGGVPHGAMDVEDDDVSSMGRIVSEYLEDIARIRDQQAGAAKMHLMLEGPHEGSYSDVSDAEWVSARDDEPSVMLSITASDTHCDSMISRPFTVKRPDCGQQPLTLPITFGHRHSYRLQANDTGRATPPPPPPARLLMPLPFRNPLDCFREGDGTDAAVPPPQQTPRATASSPPPPVSLVGCYADERSLQRGSVRKLLMEGIPCEVCCAGIGFNTLMDRYLCPEPSPTSESKGNGELLYTEWDSDDEQAEGVEATAGIATPRRGSQATGDGSVMTVRWGRLVLKQRRANQPGHFTLEFICGSDGIPPPRRTAAPGTGTDTSAHHSSTKPTTLEELVTPAVHIDGRRGHPPPPASMPTARPRERRLFSLPLYEPELTMHAHLLEAGAVRCSPRLVRELAAGATTGPVRLVRESGTQVALEVRGVPPAKDLSAKALAQSRPGAVPRGSSRRPSDEQNDLILAKRLKGGGELLVPSTCILSNKSGAFTILLRFPANTFSTSTRLESVEAIVAGLCAVMLPGGGGRGSAVTAQHHGGLDSVVSVLSHIPHILLFPNLVANLTGSDAPLQEDHTEHGSPTRGTAVGSGKHTLHSTAQRRRSSVEEAIISASSAALQVHAHFPGTLHGDAAAVSAEEISTTPNAGELVKLSNRQQSKSVGLDEEQARYVQLAALALQQLRTVTIGSNDGLSSTAESTIGVAIATRLQQLQSFRRNIRALVKQQIYNAEDIRGELVYAAVSGRDVPHGFYLRDIQLEAREMIGLHLPIHGTTSLSQTDTHPTAGTGGVPPVRGAVSVGQGRELCGFAIPWTIWQWAYRWSAVQRCCRQTEMQERQHFLLQGGNAGEMMTSKVIPGAATAEQYSTPTTQPIAASSPWTVPNGGSPGQLLDDGSSSSDDELFGNFDHDGNWMDEAVLSTPNAHFRTVWLPELTFTAAPFFLTGCENSIPRK